MGALTKGRRIRPPRLEITKRQSEVLYWLGQGKQVPAVAKILGITTRTAYFHLYRAMENLDCVTQAQAVACAYQFEIGTSRGQTGHVAYHFVAVNSRGRGRHSAINWEW